MSTVSVAFSVTFTECTKPLFTFAMRSTQKTRRGPCKGLRWPFEVRNRISNRTACAKRLDVGDAGGIEVAQSDGAPEQRRGSSARSLQDDLRAVRDTQGRDVRVGRSGSKESQSAVEGSADVDGGDVRRLCAESSALGRDAWRAAESVAGHGIEVSGWSAG